jgi:hypothetical protein
LHLGVVHSIARSLDADVRDLCPILAIRGLGLGDADVDEAALFLVLIAWNFNPKYEVYARATKEICDDDSVVVALSTVEAGGTSSLRPWRTVDVATHMRSQTGVVKWQFVVPTFVPLTNMMKVSIPDWAALVWKPWEKQRPPEGEQRSKNVVDQLLRGLKRQRAQGSFGRRSGPRKRKADAPAPAEFAFEEDAGSDCGSEHAPSPSSDSSSSDEAGFPIDIRSLLEEDVG